MDSSLIWPSQDQFLTTNYSQPLLLGTNIEIEYPNTSKAKSPRASRAEGL